MAGKNYITLDGNRLTRNFGTDSSSGVANAGDIVSLDSTGKLNLNMLPPGIGSESDERTATENLSAGDFVNIWQDGGNARIRKADAATGKPAHGFVLSAVSTGMPAVVYGPSQLNNQLTSLSPGVEYYLSATVPGGVQASAPDTDGGTILQYLGVAISATEIRFSPGLLVVM